MKLLAPFIALIIAGVAAVVGLTPHKSPAPSITPQNQHIQGVKQEYATVAHPILLSFSPSTETVNRNETFSIQLALDAHDLEVTGVDLTLPIDSSKVEFVSFNDSRALNSLLISQFDSGSGTFRFTAVDTSTRKLTGKMILGTLTLKAKAAGSWTPRPSKSQLTASGYDKAIPTDVMTATYTIK